MSSPKLDRADGFGMAAWRQSGADYLNEWLARGVRRSRRFTAWRRLGRREVCRSTFSSSDSCSSREETRRPREQTNPGVAADAPQAPGRYRIMHDREQRRLWGMTAVVQVRPDQRGRRSHEPSLLTQHAPEVCMTSSSDRSQGQSRPRGGQARLAVLRTGNRPERRRRHQEACLGAALPASRVTLHQQAVVRCSTQVW